MNVVTTQPPTTTNSDADAPHPAQAYLQVHNSLPEAEEASKAIQ